MEAAEAAGLSEAELEYWEVIGLDVQRSDRQYGATDVEAHNLAMLERCLQAYVLDNTRHGYAQGMNGACRRALPASITGAAKPRGCRQQFATCAACTVSGCASAVRFLALCALPIMM